jgi:hypothetical protein
MLYSVSLYPYPTRWSRRQIKVPESAIRYSIATDKLQPEACLLTIPIQGIKHFTCCFLIHIKCFGTNSIAADARRPAAVGPARCRQQCAF